MIDADRLWIKSMEWCSKYWGCHQMPERSFFIKKYQLPVCARCTGIILGELTALITFFIYNPPIVLDIIFMIPLIIDGIVQYKSKYESNNIKRLITGYLFGYAMISLFVSLIICLIKLIISL